MAFSAPGPNSRVLKLLPASVAAMIPERVLAMLPELVKFCVVGGLGTVIDLGGAALLQGKYHVEPLAAKAISVTLATVLTYLGSRFWTFKERENQSVGREAGLFVALNVFGLLIAEAVVGLVTYVIGLHGQLEYNAASFIGTGLGTIFRFWAYRRWVFLPPEESSGPAAPLAETPGFPDYPPWELDPAFLATVTAAAPAQTQAAVTPAPDFSPWGGPATPLTAPAAPAPGLPPATDRPPLSSPPPAGHRPQPASSAPRPARAPGRHRKS
jgi:putative flippase GtrA